MQAQEKQRILDAIDAAERRIEQDATAPAPRGAGAVTKGAPECDEDGIPLNKVSGFCCNACKKR